MRVCANKSRESRGKGQRMTDQGGASRVAVLRALWRRGAAAMLRRTRHEVWMRLGGPARALPDRAAPAGPFLPCPAGTLPLETPVLARLLAGVDRAARPVSFATGRPDDAAPWHAVEPYAHGDVRLVWEVSRFGVLPALALAARATGEPRFLDAAERHLAAFLAACPPYRGAHWASAQEAAIRLIHLVAAGLILGGAPPPGGRALAGLLAARVRATFAYERSLANNHGLVCAAALAGAGAWLGTEDRRRGERILAADLPRLTTAAGGFAQVSTRYHRMALDARASAARAGAAPAAPRRDRLAAMAAWLGRVTDPATGQVPRLGHDDGTALLDATCAGPDDARPSLVRATAAAAAPGASPLALAGLGPMAPEPSPGGWADPEGGTAGLRHGRTLALLRLPGGRFPAGQGDIMHLTLMHRGEEILRDAGTWLYNPPAGESDLAGTAHHTTAQWGEADRPVRLGRFLFAAPPRLRHLEASADRLRAACDRHDRTVAVAGDTWTVTDRLAPGATLRWRLPPGTWLRRSDGVEGAAAALGVSADGPVDLRLAQGWDSPRYGERQRIPVLTVRLTGSTRCVVTRIRLP
jgi:hypothetical protein